MAAHRVKCIINPAAAAGKARKIWPRFARALETRGIAYSAATTTGPGHATRITREALADGWPAIVALGGDGTVNEVVNGFFADGVAVNPNATLTIVPKGTGADFVRSLGDNRTPEAVAEVLARDEARPVDIGQLYCLSRAGTMHSRYFINVAELGYGSEVVVRTNRMMKLLGGFTAYVAGMLYTLLFYHNRFLHFRLDDGPVESGVFNAIIVANGQYFGGGMWIAPQAQLDDGLFDIVFVADIDKFEVIGNIPRLFKGTLARHPKITYRRGRKLEVWSAAGAVLDADGEIAGTLPATFEIIPKALLVTV